MANEFIIKNGYFSQGSSNITGSLTVKGAGASGAVLDTDTNDNFQSTRLFFKMSGSGNDVSIRNFSGSLFIATQATSGVSSGTTTAMFISRSGNVAIGNTQPTLGNLQVLGNVYATSFTGSLLGTASFATSASRAITSSFAITASNATGLSTLNQNVIITGSLTLTNDLIVLGSASVQYITSSQLNINDNIISVNTITPSVRFGGLAVIDSGSSPIQSGSLLFDSQNNQWIFVHQSAAGAAVTSSMLLMGPQTFNNVGNETALTANRVPKSSGADLGEHLTDSNISDTGTIVSINSNTVVTGSLTTKMDSSSTVQLIGSSSALQYLPDSAGGYLLLNGTASGVPRMAVTIPALAPKPAAGFAFGMRTWGDATYPGYGKVGDAFFYGGNETNGVNFMNPAGTGTEDYIRFYAGNNATATSDMHIQGTGPTRGYVGIGTENPTTPLEVGGTAKATLFLGPLTGSVFGTASWATNAVTAQNGFPYTGSAQITGSLGVTGSFIVNEYESNILQHYDIINTTNKTIQKVFSPGLDDLLASVIDWGNETLSSYNSTWNSVQPTIDWSNRILYTPGSPFAINKESVDWGNRYLRYSNTTVATPPISVNWGAGTLHDTNGATALTWNTPGILTVTGSLRVTGSLSVTSLGNNTGSFVTINGNNTLNSRTAAQVRVDINYYGLTYAMQNGYY